MLLILLACAKTTAPPPAAQSCSADTIYEAYLDALKVTREPESLQTWYARATLAQSGPGGAITTEVWWLGADGHYIRSAQEGGDTVEQGWDGEVGWVSTAAGSRRMSGPELAAFQADAALTLDNRGLYSSLDCMGRADVADKRAWALRGVLLATKDEVYTWYDPDTGLQLGHRTITPDGTETTVMILEYADHGGILWPTAMESRSEAGVGHYLVEEITLDVTTPPMLRPENL